MLRGGTRSSKSFSLTQLAVRWLIHGKIGNLYIPKGDFFILRESFPALRRTVLKDFFNILSREGLLQYVNHIKTTNEFERHGRRVSFFSADDESKIHGPQSTFFWINEATSVPEDIFHQLNFRCSEFCFLDYNPNNPESWVKRMEDGHILEEEDITLDVSTIYDNPHLSEPQVKAIKAIKDEELRNIYLKGDWTKLTGLIYPYYQLVNELPDEFQRRYFAIDFGWVDPTALLEIRQIADDIYVKEHVYESKYDYDQLATHIQAYIPACKGVGDSAAPMAIDKLRKAGIRIKPSKKGRDSIITGIEAVRAHNLYITTDSINLIKELKSYKWMKDRDTNKEIQKPIDEFNHALDALRYGITTFSRRKVFSFID